MANPEVRIRLALDGAGQVTSGVNGAAQSLERLSDTTAKVGQRTQITGQQMAQVSAQLQDLFVQLQGGAAPMTALLQQGSQLSAVFGGVGNAAAMTARAIASMINPVTAVVGVVAAATAVYMKGAAESEGYRRALLLTGNAAGITTGELQRLAAAQDAQAGTQAKAAEVLTQLAASGRVARDVLAGAADAAIRLERAGGPAAEETAKKLAQLGKEPLQALLKLDEAEGFLTASLYKRVKAMQEAGQSTEAARAAQEGYLQAISGRASELEQGLGFIERGWRGVKDAAKEAWDAMLSVGRPKDPMEEALKALEVAEQAASSIYRNERDQQRLTAAKEAVRLLQQERDLKASNAREQASSLAAERRMTQLLETNTGWLSKEARLAKELADAEREGEERIAAGLIKRADLQERLGEIRERYREKGGDKSGLRELEQEAALLERLSGLSGTYYKDLQARFALFQGGKITLQQYQQAVAALTKEQPFSKEQEASLRAMREEAARTSAEWAKGQDAYDAWVASLRKGGDSVATQVQALQDEAKATQIAAAQNITLAQAMEQVAIARLRAKYDASASDEERAALQREIEQRQQLIVELGSKASRIGTEQALKDLDKFLDPTKAQDFGAALTRAFDGAGSSLGKIVGLLGDASRNQAVFAQQFRNLGEEKDPAERARKEAQLTLMVQRESINLYAGMAGAAKNFFSEGTRGYKALEAAENAFRVYQLASDLQKGISAAALAIARQGTGGDVWTAVPRMAAMAAIMASLGYATGFLGGGGSTTGGDGAKQATGTGSVFGDAEAKSESITKSIEHLGDTAELQLRTQSGMLDALKSIESRIGGVTNQVLRSGITQDAGQRLGIQTGTSGPNLLGQGFTGGVLNLDNLLFGGKLTNALFGKTTKITGAGLFAGAQDIGSILSEGFRLQDFADINTSRKFFGLKVSNKNSTQYQDADPALARQFGLIFKDFANAITLAAGPLDLALGDVQDRLSGFVIDIGKIDLQGLNGQQIQEKLGAVLGAAADGLAEAALPGLQDFQRIGEGYFETTIRVASGIETAGQELDLLGIGAIKFGDVARKQGDVATEIVRQSIAAFESLDGSISSVGELIRTLDGSAEDLADTYRDLIDVRESLQSIGISGDTLTASLIRGAGGLDALSESVGVFFDSFLTEEEKLAARRARLQEDAARIGIANLPTDREGFRQLVSAAALNATTEAGQRFLAQVLGLADAFDEVATSSEALAQKLADAQKEREQKVLDGEKRLTQLISAQIGKFLSPSDNVAFGYQRVAASLAKDAGLQFTPQQLSTASLSQVAEFAKAFLALEGPSVDARIAVVEAAGALADLASQAGALQKQTIEDRIRAIGEQFGDVEGALSGPVEKLADRFRTGAEEIKNLEEGLDRLIHGAAKSVQDVLSDMLQQQGALKDFRTGSLADSIEQAMLDGLSPQARISALRGREATLFAQLGSAADPVSVAQRLQQTITDRIALEAELSTKLYDDQIDSLTRLRDLSRELTQATAELRIGDLSPLSAREQLDQAQALFDRTLVGARSGDATAQGALIGNARLLLEEADSFFGRNSDFARIFGTVTGSLDELALSGANLDPQIQALQGLRDAVDSGSGATYEALLKIDTALAGREADNQTRIDAQIELAKQQITEAKATNELLRDQLEVQAEELRALREQLKGIGQQVTVISGVVERVGGAA